MDILKKYAVDPKAEQDGKEFDFGGGVTLLIARSFNPKYKRMLNDRYEAFKHTLDLKGTPAEQKASDECSNKIMAEVMAHSVLLGWTGPVEYDGEPLPYSVANAEKLLLLKEFQNEVAKRADKFENFRLYTEDADTKNSLPTSSGTSLGAVALPTLSS